MCDYGLPRHQIFIASFLDCEIFLKVLLWNRSVPMNDSRFFPARTVDSDLHNFTAQLFCLDDESALA